MSGNNVNRGDGLENVEINNTSSNKTKIKKTAYK